MENPQAPDSGSLISPGYRRMMERMHVEAQSFGGGGDRHTAEVSTLIDHHGFHSVLDYGAGKGRLVKRLRQHHENVDFRQYDPGVPEFSASPAPAELTVCTDVLEHIEPICLPAVLDHLRRCTSIRTFIVVATRAADKNLPDGRNAHLTIQDASWWGNVITRFFAIKRLIHVADRGEVKITAAPRALDLIGASEL